VNIIRHSLILAHYELYVIEIRDAIDEKIDEQHKRMREINTELINRGVLEYPEDFTYETQESAEDIVRALEKEFSEEIPKTLSVS
jgi:hypothetical protein